jgi:hypothetical protein
MTEAAVAATPLTGWMKRLKSEKEEVGWG